MDRRTLNDADKRYYSTSARHRCGASAADARPLEATFRGPEATVEAYNFAELTISPKALEVSNPFTDVTVTGQFRREGGEPVRVEGFCDSQDGSLFASVSCRMRQGVTIRRCFPAGFQRDFEQRQLHCDTEPPQGDPEDGYKPPEHLVWQGSGEHYFWNGATTYYLMGWDDETIRRKHRPAGGLQDQPTAGVAVRPQ